MSASDGLSEPSLRVDEIGSGSVRLTNPWLSSRSGARGRSAVLRPQYFSYALLSGRAAAYRLVATDANSMVSRRRLSTLGVQQLRHRHHLSRDAAEIRVR